MFTHTGTHTTQIHINTNIYVSISIHQLIDNSYTTSLPKKDNFFLRKSIYDKYLIAILNHRNYFSISIFHSEFKLIKEFHDFSL